MKPKNILKYLIVAFLAAYVLGGCSNSTEAEQIFDQTPSERLNAQKKELNDALLSSEFGWKALYFTDDTQLGGFTYLFKFSTGGKVVMASDFDDDILEHESEYNVALGSTASLVFTTFNKIHLLSNPKNSPTPNLNGQGYRGDFQLLYYGQENGDLVLKSNRLVREVRFVKATQQDWADLGKNLVTEKNLVGRTDKPLFKLLEINDGKAIKKYDFGYNSVSRYSSSSSIDAGSSEVVRMGVGYTPTGLVVSPALEVAGQSLTDFLYDEASASFTATGTGGVSAAIKYSNIPLTLTNDYKILLSGNTYTRFVYFVGNYTEKASTNSDLFIKELARINSFLPTGVTIATVEFYLNLDGSLNFIYYKFVGRAPIYHFVDVSEDVMGKKVILTHKSWNGNTTVGTPAFLKEFEKYLVNAEGVYVNKESFKLYYTDPVYTFKSASSSFRMTTWKIE